MRPQGLLRVIAGIALIHGLIAIAGALWVSDITPFYQATASSSGVLLILAASLLMKERKAAVPLLWLSAAIYIFAVLYPSVASHGWGALGFLMKAFYWSVALRLALAIGAHITLVRLAQTHVTQATSAPDA